MSRKADPVSGTASVVKEVKAAFLKMIHKAPTWRLPELLKAHQRIRHQGIYIIWEGKTALYAGESRNLRNRLNAHLTQANTHSLAQYLCREKGIQPLRTHYHQCRCGARVNCEFGPHFERSASHAEIHERILKMTVSVISVDSPEYEQNFSIIEGMIIWIVRPKYGIDRIGRLRLAPSSEQRLRKTGGKRI